MRQNRQAAIGQRIFEARREVNKFLQGRMRAILLDGYTVPGITAQYAAQHQLIYHKDGDYYE